MRHWNLRNIARNVTVVFCLAGSAYAAGTPPAEFDAAVKPVLVKTCVTVRQ